MRKCYVKISVKNLANRCKQMILHTFYPLRSRPAVGLASTKGLPD